MPLVEKTIITNTNLHKTYNDCLAWLKKQHPVKEEKPYKISAHLPKLWHIDEYYYPLLTISLEKDNNEIIVTTTLKKHTYIPFLSIFGSRRRTFLKIVEDLWINIGVDKKSINSLHSKSKLKEEYKEYVFRIKYVVLFLILLIIITCLMPEKRRYAIIPVLLGLYELFYLLKNLNEIKQLFNI